MANAAVLLAVLWIAAEQLRRNDEEARRSQDALNASERRYQALVAFAPIGIYRLTREGRFVSANMALARMLGYEPPEEVLRLDLRKDLYYDNADREPILAELARLGGVGTFEVRWKRRDGAPLWSVWIRESSGGSPEASSTKPSFTTLISARKPKKLCGAPRSASTARSPSVPSP